MKSNFLSMARIWLAHACISNHIFSLSLPAPPLLSMLTVKEPLSHRSLRTSYSFLHLLYTLLIPRLTPIHLRHHLFWVIFPGILEWVKFPILCLQIMQCSISHHNTYEDWTHSLSASLICELSAGRKFIFLISLCILSIQHRADSKYV